MSKKRWKFILNVSSFYHDADVSITDKGKLMARAIKRLPLDTIELYCGDDFDLIIESFESIEDVQDITPPVEEFDNCMFELYDYADRYDIWIQTIK